jgi:hypothetical protein
MDVEGHIKPGDDFVKVLNEQVAQCDVLLAIIGERWFGALDEEGKRRLENEGDFVRIEIGSALKLGKRVIPVLVNEAEMPRADNLPESLKPFARRNAVAIRPTRFKADSEGLINALKEALAAAEVERAAKTEAERKAAEEERKRRKAEDEARARQVEAAAKARAQAGLTPEEIRKAEELANWDFIKYSTNTAEFRDHLARFAGGTTDRYARKKLEALLWQEPATRSSIEALRKFLDEFPKGDHAAVAKERLDVLERDAGAAQAEAALGDGSLGKSCRQHGCCRSRCVLEGLAFRRACGGSKSAHQRAARVIISMEKKAIAYYWANDFNLRVHHGSHHTCKDARYRWRQKDDDNYPRFPCLDVR